MVLDRQRKTSNWHSWELVPPLLYDKESIKFAACCVFSVIGPSQVNILVGISIRPISVTHSMDFLLWMLELLLPFRSGLYENLPYAQAPSVRSPRSFNSSQKAKTPLFQYLKKGIYMKSTKKSPYCSLRVLLKVKRLHIRRVLVWINRCFKQ